MHFPKIIAVSGASGSGKTSLVKALAAVLNCPYLLFDEHTQDDTYPEDMQSWLQQGADVSLIKTPQLTEALKSMLLLRDEGFIFVEEPFGRERDVMAPLIDSVVLLDVPLELCLSRNIKRQPSSQNLTARQSIANYLQRYEEYFRDIYIETVAQVRNNCDLVLQAEGSIEDTAMLVSKWLENQYSA